MINQTWSDNPVQDSMVLYGIGVQNTLTTLPWGALGPSAWFDVPLTFSYVAAWVVQANPVTGLYLTFGDHRMILNNLDIVNMSPPQTIDGYFYMDWGA
jgi:hypothetical protein